MLDHMILTVSDVERSSAFYKAVLKPLHIEFLMPAAIHWGFVAENEKKVDELYKAAMSAGASDDISPRARLEYYPGYYAADVLDLTCRHSSDQSLLENGAS